MFKEFFLLFLLGHVLGDFYFQTKKMADKKEKSFKWVFIHCLCYWAAMTIVVLPVISYELIMATAAASLLHFVIDIAKYIFYSVCEKKGKRTLVLERNLFFADQMIHLLCLVIISYELVINQILMIEFDLIKDIFATVGILEIRMLTWIISLLIIHKPANIMIQKLLLIYKPEDKENDNKKDNQNESKNESKNDSKKDNNAGRFIGTVERIVMLIFLAIGQYSAIGLVLTAKSIARYDRISKEKDFAEYYLLGTLISTVLVIVVSFII